MDQNSIRISNEKWLSRDYKKVKEQQSKLNKHYRIDFRGENEKKKMKEDRIGKKQMEELCP